MTHTSFRQTLVVGLILSAGAARAGDAAPAAAAPGVVGLEHKNDVPVGEERYVGVAPGAAGKNPLPKPNHDPAHLVWTGFQPKADGSRVFFQITRPVEFNLETPPEKGGKHAGGKHLTVFLRNCRIHLQNNRRNLDTRYFATPVAGVKARQQRKDVVLEIALKEMVTPQSRSEAGPDGSQFVVLEFPPGKAIAFSPEPAGPHTAVVDETGR